MKLDVSLFANQIAQSYHKGIYDVPKSRFSPLCCTIIFSYRIRQDMIDNIDCMSTNEFRYCSVKTFQLNNLSCEFKAFITKMDKTSTYLKQPFFQAAMMNSCNISFAFTWGNEETSISATGVITYPAIQLRLTLL